ncbi:MAG TPA: serine hydrolase [Pirellulales bacterium]|nr:serine hydrolase [Pirellulales bacterium]
MARRVRWTTLSLRVAGTAKTGKLLHVAPRGLGFAVGRAAGSPGCSGRTLGHSGSTGTLAWADAATETVCVVLTSLPSRGARPRPRDLAAERVATAARP